MRVVPPLTGHLDMALSNFTKGYRNAPMFQDRAFPRLPVLRRTDVYWVYGKENLQVTEQTLRAFGTPAAETRFTMSTENYNAHSNALKANIADEDRDTYTVGDMNMDTVAMLQDKNLLAREIRVKALMTTSGNYPADNVLALSSTSQWSDGANSTPQEDVADAKTRIRLTGQSANLFAVSEDVFNVLSVHPKLQAKFTYNVVTGPLDEVQLAKVLGVAEVFVCRAITNDGTATNDFLWSNFAWLGYVPPTVGAPGLLGGIGSEGRVGPKQLCFGKSFTWTSAPGTIDG
ncbi:MAG: hypothetical protein J0G35_21140, partial [Acidobacteriales bacterium]|nr:hypothetical protein [Terriglobales bacterium]